MKAYLINMHQLVPRSRSSAKVKVKCKGYISQKKAVSGHSCFTNTFCLTGVLLSVHLSVCPKFQHKNFPVTPKMVLLQGHGVSQTHLVCSYTNSSPMNFIGQCERVFFKHCKEGEHNFYLCLWYICIYPIPTQ